MGIIACVEVTTTTVGTTPGSTSAPSQSIAPETAGVDVEGTTTVAPPSSGTTIVPTSVSTTTVCQKDMATVGGQYVSSVTYSASTADGTDNDDLTSTSGNGITFTPVSGTSVFLIKTTSHSTRSPSLSIQLVLIHLVALQSMHLAMSTNSQCNSSLNRIQINQSLLLLNLVVNQSKSSQLPSTHDHQSSIYHHNYQHQLVAFVLLFFRRSIKRKKTIIYF